MASGPKRTGMLLPMPIWDSPTRLFHWILVLAIALCYLTDKFGAFDLHKLCGEFVLALVLFRVVWGFVGSETSRFSQFLASPVAAVQHLLHFRRREPDRQIGHNEAGGWMVVVILAMLLVQIITGLFSNDVDSFIAGPLAAHLSDDAGAQVLHYHRFNFNIIVAVIVLHLVAIAAYKIIKQHDLVPAMITGKKRLPAATPAPRMASPTLAAIIFALCAAVVWGVVKFG